MIRFQTAVEIYFWMIPGGRGCIYVAPISALPDADLVERLIHDYRTDLTGDESVELGWLRFSHLTNPQPFLMFCNVTMERLRAAAFQGFPAFDRSRGARNEFFHHPHPPLRFAGLLSANPQQVDSKPNSR